LHFLAKPTITMTMNHWIELARLTRAGLPESLHWGAWELRSASGERVDGRGDAEQRVWARSAVKAFQALPIVALGLLERHGLGDEHLAVICGSHSGEERHRRLVAEILAAAHLDETALDCGYHRPFDGASAREQIRRRLPDSPLYHNCSGKHAGMLLLHRALDGGDADYLDPSSPGQALVTELLTAFADGARPDLGIDGCSAPSYRLPLSALALAFARLAAAEPPPGLPGPDLAWDEAVRRVLAAQFRHPDLVGGSRRRLDTELIRAGGGAIISKSGAEGVHLVGFPGSGRGLAIKVIDGGDRVVGPLICALLERWQILDEKGLASLAFWGDAAQINAAGRVTGALELLPEALPE